MIEPLLAVDGLVKRFGGLLATDHVSLTVASGETHALIGPNGAGKTTLIAQVQGETASDAGRIRFDGRDVTGLPSHARAAVGLARSFQITSVFPGLTVLGNVALAIQARAGHGFRFWSRALDQPVLTDPARETLAMIGLAHRVDVLAEALSHGERRQLELAMALAMRPKLLLLDEPMAGMGRQDGDRMTRILLSLKSRYAILLVEHDMSAVAALADRVTVMVSGRILASGGFEAIRADPAVRGAYLGERR